MTASRHDPMKHCRASQAERAVRLDPSSSGADVRVGSAEQPGEFDLSLYAAEIAALFRDLNEAAQADEDLRAQLRPAARIELSRDEDRMSTIVAMLEKADVPHSAAQVSRYMERVWSLDHELRFGPLPSPSTMLRWRRTMRDGLVAPSPAAFAQHFPGAKGVVERYHRQMAAFVSDGQPTARRGPARRGRCPAVGEIVRADGSAGGRVRPDAGRVAYARPARSDSSRRLPPPWRNADDARSAREA